MRHSRHTRRGATPGTRQHTHDAATSSSCGHTCGRAEMEEERSTRDAQSSRCSREGPQTPSTNRVCNGHSTTSD